MNFERGTGVLQIGLFRDLVTAAELDGLTLDGEDFVDMKNWRPGDCDIKRSDSSIEAFRELDWEAPDVRSIAKRWHAA